MAIKDLFVPKWQHSKAGIRLESINDLGNNPTLLAEIAKTDPSPEVRAAAIKRIDDEAELTAIIDVEPDGVIRKLAVDKRDLVYKKTIATSTDPRVIIPLLEKHGGEKAIAAYLCDHARDSETQRILVGKITTPHLLCKVSEHPCSVETGEHIVGIISDKEHLQRLALKASNKKIRVLAQKKLDALCVDPHTSQQDVAKILEQCVKSMDMLVGLENCEQGEAVLDMARRVWGRYDPNRTHPAAVRFAAAEAELAGKIAGCKNLQETVRTLTSLVDQSESALSEPIEVATVRLAELDDQWNGIDKTGLSGTEYESAVGRFADAHNALTKIQVRVEENQTLRRMNAEAVVACCDEFERLVESDEPIALRTYEAILARWRTVSSTDHGASPGVERFAQLQKKYDEKLSTIAAQKMNAIAEEEEFVERMVLRMEFAANAPVEQAGNLSREISDLKRSWERHYPLARQRKDSLESRFKAAYERFMVSLFEFKDQSAWKQWATENVATKICADIEQLEARLQQGEPLSNLVRKVNVFQNDWKNTVGRDRIQTPELNQRFASVCNRIFALGVTRKTELLEQVKQVVASDAGRDTIEAIKQIQHQWNDIGYLPLAMEKDIADAFHTVCNTFFEQRREAYQNHSAELQKNIVIREEICKEGEALSGSTVWKEAIASFSDLQRKWEESWPAPMKRSRELWELFSGYRDTFFERYETYKQGNVAIKEALCTQAEQLLALISQAPPAETPSAEGDVDTTAERATQNESPEINYTRLFSQVVALQRSWKECGPVTREQNEKLWNRFHPACAQVIARVKQEHERNRALKEALVVEAESLVGSEEWEQTAQKFGSIREQWRSIPPASRHDEQVLWTRLQAAGDAFFEKRRDHFSEKKASTQKQLETREALCAEIELLVRVAGKGHLLKFVNTTSSAEALKMGISMRNEIDVEGDARKTAENIKRRAFQIMDKWDAETPGGGREFVQLENRFYAAVEILKRAT